jgi:hypothetical protein
MKYLDKKFETKWTIYDVFNTLSASISFGLCLERSYNDDSMKKWHKSLSREDFYTVIEWSRFIPLVEYDQLLVLSSLCSFDESCETSVLGNDMHLNDEFYEEKMLIKSLFFPVLLKEMRWNT